MNLRVVVIIPAHNEEKSIGKVVGDIPRNLVAEIIVVSNSSTDETESVSRKAGATVLTENRKGYGYACLKGIEYAKNLSPQPDIVVFMDGDYSDFPEEISKLIHPIIQDGFDLVIGSRVLGKREKGSLTQQQVFGNWLATKLIRLFYRERFTDLGPFRAIRFEKLLAMNMQDKTYGWTVEMQVKAAKMKMKCCEVAVSYRNRIGVSKVSGTVKGSVMAGIKILSTIFRFI